MHIQKLYILILIVMLPMVYSCQEEVIEIVQPDPTVTTEPTSKLSGLILNLATKDGSDDNIIDGASCITIQLPVMVVVNGQEIEIETEDDFSDIERILDKSNDDEDEVSLVFPVTIILPDHSEVEISSQDILEEYAELCTEGGFDDDIECVDFKYPVTFKVYNSQSQVANVITVENDQQLHAFLEKLDDEDIFSIEFPVTLILSDGNEITATDNDELEDILEEAIDACDEDDDNDYNDDDVDDTEFRDILSSGVWEISYYFDEANQTDRFNRYLFQFSTGGDVLIYDEVSQFTGQWESFGDDGIIEIEFDFDEGPIVNIEDEWDVFSYSENNIELIGDPYEDKERYLHFRKTSNTPISFPDSELASFLTAGPWVVIEYESSDVDKTSELANITFEFTKDGILVAADGATTTKGSWEEINDDDTDYLKINFEEGDKLIQLNKIWKVVDMSEPDLELSFEYEDGSSDILLLERKP